MSYKANCLACLMNTGFCILNPMLSLYVKAKVRIRRLYRKCIGYNWYELVPQIFTNNKDNDNKVNNNTNRNKVNNNNVGSDETDNDYNEYTHEEEEINEYNEDIKCDEHINIISEETNNGVNNDNVNSNAGNDRVIKRN